MTHPIKISEAASIALHTMVYLAGHKDRTVGRKEIASVIRGSEAHLAKVLQRLVKAGLVTSRTGPGGGFVLKRASEFISLLDVYEAIEGPIKETQCLLGQPVCNGRCILGGLLGSINREVRDYFSKTRLSDFERTFQGGCHESAQAHRN